MLVVLGQGQVLVSNLATVDLVAAVDSHTAALLWSISAAWMSCCR